VLFVNRATLDAQASAEVIRTIFKLTPAEGRVLLALVDAGGVADTARSLDLAESTVKTHLARIFTKTRTRRQAELIKLVAAFTSPARG
jgi:DNA-binding CsgD family transcriptional regulator